MEKSENIKLYFFCKKYIAEDLPKSDILELASERFPEMTKKEFDSAYSEAFSLDII